MTATIKVGLCGFCLSQAELFSRFSLLEVQQTFYWPPQLKTVERWRRAAPGNFEFTVKAFQAVTHPGSSPTYRRAKFTEEQRRQCGHFRDTEVVREAWTTTKQLALALRARFVVFQCPPRFVASQENIAQLWQFFRSASRGDLQMVWEPRHVSWTDDLIAELCRDLDLIHAVDPLERQNLFGAPAYYRLHGQALGDYRYDYDRIYSDADLEDIYSRSLPGPSIVLFNNMQMASDADRFAGLVSARR